MIPLTNTKTVILLRPQLKNNGAFANNTHVDTSAWKHARFKFLIGDTDAAVGSGDASTAPFIEECDTTGGTYTAVSGAALAAVISATDDNSIKGIDVSLTKTHKRYMRVKAPTADNGSTGANLAIECELSRPDRGPASAAAQGYAELVSA